MFFMLDGKSIASFFFKEKVKVEEVNKKNFKDNIFGKEIDWTYNDLLKFKKLFNKWVDFIYLTI